ncbi:Uncharacterised protein [Legionella pneumophila]|nr:Uncharacterised protein [Legionella pneumophila]
MPPSSSDQVEESSAATKATGIKKIIAEKIKKKIKVDPKSAVPGKFLMLSIAPVMSSTKARTDIFSEDHDFIDFSI